MAIEKEQAILVGVQTTETTEQFEDSLTELQRLTETAQGEVVQTFMQKRAQVDQKTILGKGRLAELAELVAAENIDIVIFNQPLTPSQLYRIQQVLEVRVIDRIQLILDIFAMRARSKEGKLQVSLAQLKYLLPRLSGQGIALSKLGGGIGTRGPGETKLETDRRHIQNQMIVIQKELKQVAAHRARNRGRRKQNNLIRVGLVGYTNAGKSTLLNHLTSAATYEENQLFATLDPLTRQWHLPTGTTVSLTDTVGFIQDLPTILIEAFQATLEEIAEMDILLHVVDASAHNRVVQEQTVLQILQALLSEKLPIFTVYNKRDQLTSEFVPTLFPNRLISANNEVDLQQFNEEFVSFLKTILTPYILFLPSQEGKKLSQLKQQTILVKQIYDENRDGYLCQGFQKERRH